METPLPPVPSVRRASCVVDAASAGRLHDLANIIQVVSSGVRMLERHPSVQGVSALQPVLADVLCRTERASSILRDFLTPEVAAPAVSVADAAKVIASVRRDLAPLVGRRIRLMARCEPELPLIACPASGLEDALINLVFNARDALPKGGLILLRARPRREAGAVVGVELSVDDTGEGMPMAVRERALEPYFSTKRDSGGTGLGLAMVQRLAEQAGGAIAIASEPGRGTRVTLLIPAAPAFT